MLQGLQDEIGATMVRAENFAKRLNGKGPAQSQLLFTGLFEGR